MQAENVITKYLVEAKGGNGQAYNKVYELVYEDLKQIAHHRLSGFKRGETLNDMKPNITGFALCPSMMKRN